MMSITAAITESLILAQISTDVGFTYKVSILQSRHSSTRSNPEKLMFLKNIAGDN